MLRLTRVLLVILFGSLAVNAGVLVFAGWLFAKAQNESPKVVDGPTCIVKLVKP